MPSKPCLTCGALSASSYCPKHTPSRFNAARGSGGRAATFRRKTLATTGGTCAWCGSTDRVQAHHVVPVAQAPEQEVGVPLCRSCHVLAERGGRS